MNAVRTGVTPIAWLIAPSALLFALFFFCLLYTSDAADE